MGYRGKVAERNRARDLRAEGWTYREIAGELGVSKSSVSLWVRDVAIRGQPRRADRRFGPKQRPPNSLQRRKQTAIASLCAAGRERVGAVSGRDLLVAGTMLYAGEGDKTDGRGVRLANSDPRMIALFLTWLRRFFALDESRLRLRLYIHEGLDLEAANAFWSDLTGIPVSQFMKPYRAAPHAGIRTSKHPLGCPSVVYNDAAIHREVMGLVDGLLSPDPIDPG